MGQRISRYQLGKLLLDLWNLNHGIRDISKINGTDMGYLYPLMQWGPSFPRTEPLISSTVRKTNQRGINKLKGK